MQEPAPRAGSQAVAALRGGGAGAPRGLGPFLGGPAVRVLREPVGAGAGCPCTGCLPACSTPCRTRFGDTSGYFSCRLVSVGPGQAPTQRPLGAGTGSGLARAARSQERALCPDGVAGLGREEEVSFRGGLSQCSPKHSSAEGGR